MSVPVSKQEVDRFMFEFRERIAETMRAQTLYLLGNARLGYVRTLVDTASAPTLARLEGGDEAYAWGYLVPLLRAHQETRGRIPRGEMLYLTMLVTTRWLRYPGNGWCAGDFLGTYVTSMTEDGVLVDIAEGTATMSFFTARAATQARQEREATGWLERTEGVGA